MRRFVPLLAIGAFAAAAPAHAREDEQAWQTLTVTVALPDDFKLSNELVVRSGNDRGLYEAENTISVGKKLNSHVTVWLGYTHDPQYLHGDFTVMEHRARQQVNFENFAHFGKVKLGGRVRLEERWREGQTGTGWRMRPAVKASMPLIGKSTLTLQSESFVNFNTTGFQRVSGYDRVRNSVAVTVPLSKKINFDFGYLNQTTFVRGGENTGDHVFTLGLAASF